MPPLATPAGAPPTFTLPDLPTTDHDFVLACRREAEADPSPAKTFQLSGCGRGVVGRGDAV